MFRVTSTDGVVTRSAMPTWFQRIRFAEPRLHQTPIEDDAPPKRRYGLLPATRRSFVPACRPDQKAGSPRLWPGSPVTMGARGRGSTRKPLLLHHRIKSHGDQGERPIKAMDSRVISLWRYLHSLTQSDRLCKAPG